MMMNSVLDYLRLLLYAVIMFVGFLLFQAWEKEHPKPDTATIAATSTPPRYVPSAAAPSTPAAPPALETAPVATTLETKSELIHVTTDTMQVTIDTNGGDVVGVQLRNYPETLHGDKPFLLLNDEPSTRYIAESGLLSKMGPDTEAKVAQYTVTQKEYVLAPNQQVLSVNLNYQKNGLSVVKTFTFTRQSYEINVGFLINNKTAETWQGNLYTALMRTNTPPANTGGIANLSTYFGAAYSSADKPFIKIPFKQMQDANLNQTIKGGWAAMIQHYFISAWIPNKNSSQTYYSRVSPDGLYTIGMIAEPLTIASGSSLVTQAKLYTGPAIAEQLEKAAPHLDLTIDYGWFWIFSVIIFWMMQHIYDVVHNWGWSIVLVTVLIKILFYYFSAKSYHSMNAMKRLQPKLQALKERYGSDRQKLTQATLQLYREEKVNPMSGCLPILIQIPVFIALYWVLVESVELRQAPFILWIHDLSQPDPYYVLPVLMGLSMLIQQWLNPPPPDPTQAKVMKLIPFIFVILFARSPAGLMLYWFVNNTISCIQQWYIMSTSQVSNDKTKS